MPALLVLYYGFTLQSSLWDGNDRPYNGPPLPEYPRVDLSFDPSDIPWVAVVMPIPCISSQELIPTPHEPRQGILSPPVASGSRTISISSTRKQLSDHISVGRLQSITAKSFAKEARINALGGFPTLSEMVVIWHIQAGKRWEANKERSDFWILQNLCNFQSRGEQWLPTPEQDWYNAASPQPSPSVSCRQLASSLGSSHNREQDVDPYATPNPCQVLQGQTLAALQAWGFLR